MDDWNSNMDAAPKDGTRLLFWVPPYGPTTGHAEMFGPNAGKWNLHSVMNWDATPTHWILPVAPTEENPTPEK